LEVGDDKIKHLSSFDLATRLQQNFIELPASQSSYNKIVSRVTRSVREKSPKMWPSPLFGNKIMNYLFRGKKERKLHNLKKTVQRKQSPNRRKFAQSGHPDSIRIRKGKITIKNLGPHSGFNGFFQFSAQLAALTRHGFPEVIFTDLIFSKANHFNKIPMC
jgi:hypothetical protein